MSDPVDAEIEAEIDRLRSMPKAELRVRYRALFKAEPLKAFGPDLLRRSIAYRIQEQAYGGLDPANRRLLNNLMAQQAKSKDGRIMVLEDGFAYAGKTYGSLSEIARLITGARWNGPRFFGLRSDDRGPEK
jgi:hypothetical protein